MNMNKILFPTDFSHTGDAALEMALSMARDTGATGHVHAKHGLRCIGQSP